MINYVEMSIFNVSIGDLYILFMNSLLKFPFIYWLVFLLNIIAYDLFL